MVPDDPVISKPSPSGHGERFKTRSDAKHQVFEYIEAHYHRKRLHSKLDYLSPIAFETKKVA
ncbi:MAG: hypothetical protein EXR90_01380 [Methyloglobulus sp.]|nr:hypothetical protein [Methyloglobulus sp.]